MQQSVVNEVELPRHGEGAARGAEWSRRVSSLSPGAIPHDIGSGVWPSKAAVSGHYAAVWERLLVGEL